jgi:uncharacterized Zn-binding protein involved in type VI secretion
MSQPAAKQGDKVQGVDIHIVMIPSPGGPVPTPLPHPFSGTIMQGTSNDVMIEKMPAATVDSVAMNLPPHIPQGGPFQMPPSNQGKIMMGSATVLINGKPAARMGEMVRECNDPIDSPTGSVIASSTVLIGGPSAPTGMAPPGGGAALTDQSFEKVSSDDAKSGGQGARNKSQNASSDKSKGSLEIACLDQDKNPVEDCDYEIILPSGEKRKGKTDSEGKIREQNVDPGSSEVHLYPKEA